MSVVGGSILSVTIAGRNFAVGANEDARIHTGGWISRVERNGDGSSRIVQEFSNWTVSGLALVIDHGRGDLLFLCGHQNAGDGISAVIGAASEAIGVGANVSKWRKFLPIEIELIDGTVYRGAGVVVGKVEASSMTALAPVDFEGDGELSL